MDDWSENPNSLLAFLDGTSQFFPALKSGKLGCMGALVEN
jgi:hypothetical protein